jgi:hypothetical protein
MAGENTEMAGHNLFFVGVEITKSLCFNEKQ